MYPSLTLFVKAVEDNAVQVFEIALEIFYSSCVFVLQCYVELSYLRGNMVCPRRVISSVDPCRPLTSVLSVSDSTGFRSRQILCLTRCQRPL